MYCRYTVYVVGTYLPVSYNVIINLTISQLCFLYKKVWPLTSFFVCSKVGTRGLGAGTQGLGAGTPGLGAGTRGLGARTRVLGAGARGLGARHINKENLKKDDSLLPLNVVELET
jgi:hypothetical protein